MGIDADAREKINKELGYWMNESHSVTVATANNDPNLVILEESENFTSEEVVKFANRAGYTLSKKITPYDYMGNNDHIFRVLGRMSEKIFRCIFNVRYDENRGLYIVTQLCRWTENSLYRVVEELAHADMRVAVYLAWKNNFGRSL